MSIHDEHRQRMKERYERYGLDNFQEHEVLEMLLFYTIARKNTNPIAHRLIERFQSLDKVLSAPIQELEKVEGVGHTSALYLKTLNDLEKYRAIHREKGTVIVSSVLECGNYMLPYFKGSKVEKVFMLCLDAKGKVLCCREVSEGTVNATTISIRKIAEIALTEGATAVVLAHNHPTGLAVPSDKDIATTIQAEQALAAVDVGLIDHLIMDTNDFISMAESGAFRPRFIYTGLQR